MIRSGMISRLRTYAALGLPSLARAGTYRLALRGGLHPVQRLNGSPPAGPFYAVGTTPPAATIARRGWQETGSWFGRHAFAVGHVPDWHANPFNGNRIPATRPWFAIPDFDTAIGDIKTVWEASRFDWLLAMAQRAALGDGAELSRLNLWLDSWTQANPPYFGANWKCGQEASIRVMHLALAAMLSGQDSRPLPGLADLIRLHLRRIAPTVGYAVAQQNNHGTSEGAALFIGGSWLGAQGDAEAAGWARTGHRLLEERARTLIAADGSFSQHSLVYHRVMLDTYALAETWRRRWRLPPFSTRLCSRLAAATLWLQQFVDRTSGDGPNFGANDGAQLMVLADADNRDFRPSLQWAAALFCDARALAEPGPWDQTFAWLRLPQSAVVLPAPTSRTFDQGGMHVLRCGNTAAYLRYPRFRFRPGHADALHVDLWHDGRNVLRDGGTYAYGAEPDDHAYFSGTAAHNTIQFDGRDQMPRLSRFLFAAWLKACKVEPVHEVDEGVTAGAAYRDWQGAIHNRRIHLRGHELTCIDRVGGNARTATLRWRLAPGQWRHEGSRITDGRVALVVTSDDPAMRLLLGTGRESRYYLDQKPLAVVEATVRVPAKIVTRIEL